MKNDVGMVFVWCLKCFLPAIIALLILSALTMFYYNYGIRKTNPSGATDYVWENHFYSVGYEGHAMGFTDSNGLNNAFPHQDEIDILVMGSSQMEARNVPQKRCTTYLLNTYMKENNVNLYAYNIGVEGHTLYTLVKNLESALNEYKPQSYVILETKITDLDIDKMQAVINGTYERTPAYDSGMVYYLQKIPYLRLIHKQISNYNVSRILVNDLEEQGSSAISNEENYYDTLDSFISLIDERCKQKGCKPIIFFIPEISVSEEGIEFDYDYEKLKLFKKSCYDNNIEFVDLSERYLKEYNESFILPYGFNNTRVGNGHLNSFGHQLVAEELYKKIVSMEDEF